MTRDQIIEGIRAQATDVAALGATSLYIYGSRVRGDARPDSDLDAYVDFDASKFGFVELIRLEQLLSEKLGLDVHVGTHDALHPLMRQSIEQEAIRVL